MPGVILLAALIVFLITMCSDGDKDGATNKPSGDRSVDAGTESPIQEPAEVGSSAIAQETPTKEPTGERSANEIQLSPVHDTIPDYVVLDEELYDAPVKTMVATHALVSGEVSQDDLEDLLWAIYRKTMDRSGFTYSDHPTQVFVYIYSTRERWEAGNALWMAMLSWSEGETYPDLRFSERQIQAANTPSRPVEKFGLSEMKRRRLYRDICRAEDYAARKAQSRYPLRSGMSGDVGREQLIKQAEYSQEVLSARRAELAEEHDLTQDQLNKILVEGIENGWVDR